MVDLFPCYICKQRLSREAFYENNGRAPGISSACRSCAKTCAAKWNREHKERVAARDRGRAAKRAITTKRWQQVNRNHLNKYMLKWNKSGKRRPGPRAMAMLTPPWANRFFIGEIYALARLRSQVTNMPWEVDHIMPLNGPTVCGLHVESNLRVVPRLVNRSKTNKLQGVCQ